MLTESYSDAILVWPTLQNALNDDDESAALVGTFDANLHPIHMLIAERLDRASYVEGNNSSPRQGAKHNIWNGFIDPVHWHQNRC
ncbi:MAG: hypothetical protein M1834_000110 [Cirrosporium novae-zelandiae]|nr:MAG: hypothetical protein M1834_000110 [Cirrosporium novae-zelandiae]